MEYCVLVELPLGDTDQWWTAFHTEWNDLSGAKRDQTVIQQNMAGKNKTTILMRNNAITVYEG